MMVWDAAFCLTKTEFPPRVAPNSLIVEPVNSRADGFKTAGSVY